MQASGPNGAIDAITNYGYDFASRLKTVSIANLSAIYTRPPNRGVIGEILFKNGTQTIMTTTQSFDAMNRFQSASSVKPGNVTAHSTSYNFNAANQRDRADREDGTHWSYAYDDLGQVTGGSHLLSGSTPVTGEQFGYVFDRIGNRTQTTINGQTAAYSPNLLNQYTQRSVPGVVEVSGQAAADAAVTINSQAAARQGELFFSSLTVSNSSAPVKQSVSITGTKSHAGPQNQDVVTTQTKSAYVPKTPEVFSYDDDGNLTGSGEWSYTWDGENRLIGAERIAGAVAAGMPKLKLAFAYDGQSRRIEKRVYEWNTTSSSYELSRKTKFIYDGWNLLAELDFLNQPIRSYVWGLDLSGSEQGAGGVSGMLMEKDAASGDSYFPAYDGNGNVMALLRAADGAISARYEYGPFGELLRSTGVMAEGNPFRFSTKYQDKETGLLYCGYRYYQSTTGRWINIDPIQEQGGINLYAFVNNSVIQKFDFLGLKPVKTDVFLCDVSFHGFIMVGGTTAGFWPARISTWGAVEAALLARRGQILSEDPHSTDPVVDKRELVLDDCNYDIKKFKRVIMDLIRFDKGSPPVYNVLLFNCYNWRDQVISDAMSASEIK